MSEQPINTNPWAEKLQQVSLPEPAEAKQKLFPLPDQEMTLPPQRDYRRWILLIILLLLLLGVCNCPGRISFRNNIIKINHPVILNTGTPGGQQQTPQAITTLHKQVKQRTVKHTKHATTITYKDETVTAGAGDIRPAIVTANKGAYEVHPAPVMNKIPAPANDTALKKTTADTTANKKPVQKDKKGWAVAAGLNQSFPVGRRQNISISDYIPTLQLRYHFNEKWYVQAELAIHAPQYVHSLPLQQRYDSAGLGVVQHGVFLEKLIYLQVPLGIYYSPLKNVYTGAGIRPGILNNAMGLFEDRITRGIGANTVLRSKTQSLKSDSTMGYYKALGAMDWQWYADINYRWKQFLAGLRYNRGMGNFINTTVPGGVPAKASNSSAQLYIRYTLWRQRPAKKLPVK